MKTLKIPNKVKSIGLHTAGTVVSIAVPAWAIFEKLPIWTRHDGIKNSIGVGGVLILIITILTLRKTIFNYFKEKLKLKTAPPLFMWISLFIIVLVISAIGTIISDLKTICIAGIIGSGAGSLMIFFANNIEEKMKEGNEHGKDETTDTERKSGGETERAQS